MPTYRYNVGVEYPGTGAPGVNVWHFRSDDPIGAPDVLPVIRDFYTAIRPNFSSQLTWRGDAFVIEDPYGSPTYVPVPQWAVTGSNVVALGPRAVQHVVSWYTTSATRSGRGRTFLGPFLGGASLLDGNGQITVAANNVVQTAAEDLITASTGLIGAAVGVYSREDGVIRDIIRARASRDPAVLRSRRD